MAEEDLIFGKNRHMFGGIEPSNMLHFSAMPVGGKIRITANLPNDTIINGQTLCTVAGALIRRKTTGYPTDEFDGTLVADVKTSGVVMDASANITTTYYYAAFPYTTQGVYNRNPNNRFLYNFTNDHYYYGYDINLSDSNSATRVSYPAECTNANYAPAYMDFTSGTFNYGGWSIIKTPGKGFMPKPCMLNYGTNTVMHYLYPDDYSYKCTYNSNGEPVKGTASAVSDPASGANAMMQWPKIYTHREEVNGVYKFRCSDIKLGDDWDCWCNYDENNNEIPYFYTSIYTGRINLNSNYNDRLRSISGVLSDPQTSDTALYNAGKNYISSGWRIDVLADYLLIQDLLVLMAKDTDGQSKYGYGYMWNKYSSVSPYSNTGPIKNGTMDSKGMFWGSSSHQVGVKVFGMENRWGNYIRFMAGMTYRDNTCRVKLTIGTHDGSTVTDYSNDAGSIEANRNGYKYIGGYGNGFISGMTTYSFGRLPSAGNGASTTFECDAYNTNTLKDTYTGGAGTGNVGFGFQYRNDSTSYGGVIGPFHLDSSISFGPTKTGGSGVYIVTSGLSCKPSA